MYTSIVENVWQDQLNRPVLVALLLVMALWLAACEQQRDFSIQDGWARPGFAGGNSAVYFRLENPTAQEDLLLSASTDAAAHAELHESRVADDGTVSMHPQESVPVPARGSVEFRPAGLHVMLIDLHEDLIAGDMISLTLTFQNVGDITLPIPVADQGHTEENH